MNFFIKKSLPLLLVSGGALLFPGISPHPTADCSGYSTAREETLERGKASFFQGRYEEALEIWAASEDGFPCSFPTDKWKARALIMTGRSEDAVKILSPYLDIIPEHPELLMLLGMARLETGEFEHAMILLESGERFLSGAAGLYLTMADAYYRYGLDSMAAEAKRKARLLLSLDSGVPLGGNTEKKEISREK